MGLPPAATYVGTASFAELMRRIPGLSVAIEPRVALDRLEPVVRAEAERLFGVDPTSVAVDWRLSDADTVTITATPRELVDARVDAAASAGIVLTALDSDADAALRGCRLCAAVELPGENPWCAVWAGCGIVCAWLVEAQRVTREARFGVRDPGFVAHDTRAMVEALARFVDDTALAGVVVAGEPDALGAIGVTTDALGAALGCVVREFSAGGFCDAGQVDGASCTDPAFAVAFGLALRGVLE
jgi:Tfp pilus assembly PilM family ATPase